MRRQCQELSSYPPANDGRARAHAHDVGELAHADCCVFDQRDRGRDARNVRVPQHVLSARVLSSGRDRVAAMVACLQNKKTDGLGPCMQTLPFQAVIAGLRDVWNTRARLISKR